jgi:hypothetical protein
MLPSPDRMLSGHFDEVGWDAVGGWKVHRAEPLHFLRHDAIAKPDRRRLPKAWRARSIPFRESAPWAGGPPGRRRTFTSWPVDSVAHRSSSRECLMNQITELLERMRAGDDSARNALFAAAYEDLRKLARRILAAALS